MTKSDLIIIIGVAIIWLFITVNLNTILGLIYIAMIYFYWNKKQSGKVYPIIRGKENLSRVLGIGVVIAFIWVYLISGMVGSIAPAVGLEKLQKMFAIVDKPMHPYMSLFIVGLLIPITEEMFFRGGVIPYLKERVRLANLLLIVVSASIFSIWHLMAYQGNNTDMVSGFLFGALASFLTIKRGHLIEAICVHSILNMMVMASSLGFLTIVGV
jgi:membrane protease YdiL (CAAX protease family)